MEGREGEREEGILHYNIQYYLLESIDVYVCVFVCVCMHACYVSYRWPNHWAYLLENIQRPTHFQEWL